jgi:glutaredoxin
MVINIVSIPDCPWCSLAEHDLRKSGNTPEVMILHSKEERELFKNMHNIKTFPQIFVDNSRIGGYQEIKQWLMNAH